MDYSVSDDDSLVSEFDIRRDAKPTAMDSYVDNVLSTEEQDILDELKINLCREDLIYLNEHKEVNIYIKSK